MRMRMRLRNQIHAEPLPAPTGKRTTPSHAEQDPANIRALEQENESADILSKHGYQVEQNPKVPGRKNPDFRIEGEIFDNYAPTTSSPRSIWTTIQEKVIGEQARRIALILSDSDADLPKLKVRFDQWPIEGLVQIIVVRSSTVIKFWP
jgi:Contact-dependent growth inhibition CdiA C-terminal domain